MSGPTGVRPLVGLLLAHQRRAWRTGAPALVETYLERRPALADDADAVLDLIYNEVVLRAEAGESPTLDEYVARFPRLARALELQFALEGAIASEPSSLDRTLRNGLAPLAGRTARPVIPGYELLGELGRGGMGVVYKALQLRLNRVVALKMILSGSHAPPEAAVRFLAEAEAVARLHHPNIVQIHALGDHEGNPYYEMEYAPGGSLADRLDGTPWPLRDAARLVEVLARALHEAHRLNIVHRDLKPANVLLAADGTPKVADFGLAKWLDLGSGLTATDHILGSPSYMAPEQAGGGKSAVGPAADVYSLGAILYELLTGRPPFRAATLFETLEQARSIEPVPPTRLRPGLPRDLETICLKCLAKEPARRYHDAAILAEDLRRFEAGEPVRARPVSPWERGWRWCRRNPALAALALALFTGLVGVATQSWRAERHLRREIAACRALEVSRRGSHERFELGMHAIGEYATLSGDEELLKDARLEGLRRKMLGKALAFYRGLQASLEADPTPQARSQMASAYDRMGSIQLDMDSRSEALASYQRALLIWEALVRDDPNDPGARSAAARSLIMAGFCQRARGRPDEALASFEKGLAIDRELVRRHAGVDDYEKDLAWCVGNIGTIQHDRGQEGKAVRSQRSAVAIREELVRRHPLEWTLRRDLAWTLNDLAMALDAAGRPADALASFERAGALWQQLDREKTGDAMVRSGAVQSHVLAGDILRTSGRWEEASLSYEKGIQLAQLLSRDYPGSARVSELLAWSQSAAGRLHVQLGRPDEALRRHESALAIREALVRHDRDDAERLTNVARSLGDMGIALEAAGRPAQALVWVERAEKTCEHLARLHPADQVIRKVLAACLTERGLIERRAGRPDAVRSFERLVPLREAMAADRPECPMDQTSLVLSYLHRATARAAAGRIDEAMADLRNVERIAEHSPHMIANVFYNLACAYAQCSAGRDRNALADRAGERLEAQRLEEKAMRSLREAVARGFRYVALIRRDRDLDPLRARPDFQRILADLSFPADPFSR